MSLKELSFSFFFLTLQMSFCIVMLFFFISPLLLLYFTYSLPQIARNCVNMVASLNKLFVCCFGLILNIKEAPVQIG